MIAHILILLLVFSSLGDAYFTKKLRESTHPHRRIRAYVVTIVQLVACAGLVQWSIRPTAYWSSSPNGWLLLAVPITLAILYVTFQPAYKILQRPELLEKTDKSFQPLAYMLPQSSVERAWFVPLCFAAGVCEELIFRQFVVDYFASGVFQLPLWIAILCSCLLFGLNHSYQGLKGVVSTSIIAGLMCVVVLGFGSLLPAMVLHTVFDLRVLPMLKISPATAERSDDITNLDEPQGWQERVSQGSD